MVTGKRNIITFKLVSNFVILKKLPTYSNGCFFVMCYIDLHKIPKKSLLKPVNYLSNALGNDLMFCFVHVLNFFLSIQTIGEGNFKAVMNGMMGLVTG